MATSSTRCAENGAAPQVSVIVATYNCAEVLHLTLQAIAAQEFADFEVLVVGDGCTDSSAQVVARMNDARFHWHNLAHNSGSQSAPNNSGIALSRGKYIAFCGHDDLWFPWHLRNLVTHLETTKNDFAHASVAFVAPFGVQSYAGAPPGNWTYANYFAPPSTWLQTREIAEKIGVWRAASELPWPPDFDVLRRAHFAGAKITHVETLGVLKFLSGVWKTYALEGAPPQTAYIEAILTKPRALQLRILEQAAAQFSNIQAEWQRVAQIPMPFRPRWIARHLLNECGDCARYLIDWTFQRVGCERNFIRQLMRLRYNRWRNRKFRRARGLKKAK